jgi:hypothetical protein
MDLISVDDFDTSELAAQAIPEERGFQMHPGQVA